jgi:hypothetical protein
VQGFFWSSEKVLKLVLVVVAQFREHTKTTQLCTLVYSVFCLFFLVVLRIKLRAPCSPRKCGLYCLSQAPQSCAL